VGLHFELHAASTVVPIWIQVVVNSYHTDVDAVKLLQELVVSSPNVGGYSLLDGVIRYKTKIWVGNNTALQTKLIAAFHASVMGGHSAIQTTHHRLKKLFHLQGMKQYVETFIKQCAMCQQAKHEFCKYHDLLQPLHIPQRPWTDISMDFIEGLPSASDYTVILVIVGRFTKYSHFSLSDIHI
jgi:hypothetical protein